ncbi:MAG: hypothetical protein U0996_02210 [Planctomycetaceae bacterium]
MNQSANQTWEPQPAGAAWIAGQVQRFRTLHSQVEVFERLLREHTGTRIADWIDHLIVSDVSGISEAGYELQSDGWYIHPAALLPPVKRETFDRMMLRIDSVSQFAVMNGHRFSVRVEGEALDPLRQAFVDTPNSRGEFGVIEHRGCNIRLPAAALTDSDKVLIQKVREQLRLRRRSFESIDAAFESTESLLRTAMNQVGRDMACDLFFEGERAYWQGRNKAARIQLMRQESLGLGWGNHDHHTYRSSRVSFSRLIGLLEMLGFQCRERFYAGREAGWGAQVIEQPVCGVVIFADVDLSPEEITGDFSHQRLSARSELGTIGLWCGLHGEALFEAGMHHLECQFDFDGARSQLEAFGVRSMKPFTDFPFLRQCFTEGERWSVCPQKIETLHSAGLITAEQAERFRTEGAVGSHLEILERNDGYRGFNQTGINDIIRKTDPRFLSVGH